MLRDFKDYFNRYYKKIRDFDLLSKTQKYNIDHDRSTALRKVELDKRNATMRIEFQKTPHMTYDYWYNTHHHDIIKEFFDSAVKNESRSWGKTFHLFLNLHWISPK